MSKNYCLLLKTLITRMREIIEIAKRSCRKAFLVCQLLVDEVGELLGSKGSQRQQQKPILPGRAGSFSH